MKMQIWLLTLLIVASVIGGTDTQADDVRLANGRVLRNVTVNRIESDGIVVTPPGFAQGATKYDWRFLHPEETTKYLSIRAREAYKKDSLMAVENTSVIRAIQVIQVMDNGVLAHLAPAVEVFDETASPKKSVGFHRKGDWQDEVVFIYLENTKKLLDGDKSAGHLYPVGRMQYTTALGATKTVASYAVTPEHAIEIIRSRSGKDSDK